MDLVREEDRSVIELKEGQRCELGRGSGLVKEADESVSRLHVVVELLRPASRKGKEVVGEFPALKLHVQVVGRNPICITSAVGGAEDKNTPRVKFVGRGENDWLAPGDRFALSIRRPVFFLLRQRAFGSLGRDEGGESLSSERTIIKKTVEDSIDNSVEKNVMDAEASSLDEEEGIAKAVARRQRRRLEREEEEQRRMELSEQQQKQAQSCGLERTTGRVQPDAESQEVASVVLCQDSGALHPFDPVAEFGFVVKGSEFQAYEKRTKTANGLPWIWKIDKKGEIEEGDSVDEPMVDLSGRNSKILAKKLKPSEEEDEEWGGDSKEEEERIAKAVRSKVDNSVSTKSGGSNTTEHKGKNSRTPDALLSKRSERVSKEANDLSGFVVDDDDSIEEFEDEEDWMDDEGTPHETEKGVSSKKSQKPVCKYGSNCYRKNKEHLAQFSHQQR